MTLSVGAMPAVNAALNATSFVLLVVGYYCIRAKQITAHTLCMVAACGVSALFLMSYVTYHLHVGSVGFSGQGWIRPVYYAILLSHTVLAIVIVPLVARTLWLAIRKRFEQHERLARVTLPLWLYVSMTGVLVYLMLYQL